jgi:hypothetical protein
MHQLRQLISGHHVFTVAFMGVGKGSATEGFSRWLPKKDLTL